MGWSVGGQNSPPAGSLPCSDGGRSQAEPGAIRCVQVCAGAHVLHVWAPVNSYSWKIGLLCELLTAVILSPSSSLFVQCLWTGRCRHRCKQHLLNRSNGMDVPRFGFCWEGDFVGSWNSLLAPVDLSLFIYSRLLRSHEFSASRKSRDVVWSWVISFDYILTDMAPNTENWSGDLSDLTVNNLRLGVN